MKGQAVSWCQLVLHQQRRLPSEVFKQFYFHLLNLTLAKAKSRTMQESCASTDLILLHDIKDLHGHMHANINYD